MNRVFQYEDVPKGKFILRRYAVDLNGAGYLYSAYVNTVGTPKLHRVVPMKNSKWRKMEKTHTALRDGDPFIDVIAKRVRAKLRGKRIYQSSEVQKSVRLYGSAVKSVAKKCPICGKVGKTCRKCSAMVKQKLADAKKFKPVDVKDIVAVTEGTLIKMDDGSTKRIEDIRPGHLLKTSKGKASRVVDVNLKEVIDEEYKEDEERWRKDDETPLDDIIAVCNNPVNLKGVFEKGIEYFYKGEHPLNNNLIYVEDGEGKQVLVNRNQFSLR